MAGTLVRDSAATNLLTGATLNAAGSTNGGIVDLSAEGTDVTFILTTGTVTGTTPTIAIELKTSTDSAFATSQSLGAFGTRSGTGASQSTLEYSMTTHVPHRYVRATVTLGGTSPVYTGSTLYGGLKHYHRTNTTTA